MQRSTKPVIKIDTEITRHRQFIATSVHVEVLTELLEKWGDRNRLIALVGGAGSGKSVLLSHLWHKYLDDKAELLLALDYELREANKAASGLLLDGPGFMNVEQVKKFVGTSRAQQVIISMRTEQAMKWSQSESLLVVQLPRLPHEDTKTMLDEYSRVVSGQHFTREAEWAIHDISGGIPRKIMRLAEQSMLDARHGGWGRVDRQHVWMAQSRLVGLQKSRAVRAMPISRFIPITGSADSMRIVG